MFDRLAQRPQGVLREGSQRGQPEDFAGWWGFRIERLATEPVGKRAEENGQGFPLTGGRVEESGPALGVCFPGFPLELERVPAFRFVERS
jgi:hypothetical protein